MYTRYAQGGVGGRDHDPDRDRRPAARAEVIASVPGRECTAAVQVQSGVHRVSACRITESRRVASTRPWRRWRAARGGPSRTSRSTRRIHAHRSLPRGRPGRSEREHHRLGGPGHTSRPAWSSSARTKSQHKNKAKAIKVLQARLPDLEQSRLDSSGRRAQGPRSARTTRGERIRTYNFPQNRVTDHRAQVTLHQLDRVMEGELDELDNRGGRDDHLEAEAAGGSTRSAPRQWTHPGARALDRGLLQAARGAAGPPRRRDPARARPSTGGTRMDLHCTREASPRRSAGCRELVRRRARARAGRAIRCGGEFWSLPLPRHSRRTDPAARDRDPGEGRARRKPAPALERLGVGSGCISAALLRELPPLEVVAVDVSGRGARAGWREPGGAAACWTGSSSLDRATR